MYLLYLVSHSTNSTQYSCRFFTKLQTTEKDIRHFSHQLLFVSDSSGMWEEQEEEEGEDEGLAGQLLSDLIASNKYGTPQRLGYSCILSSFPLSWIYSTSCLYCYSGFACSLDSVYQMKFPEYSSGFLFYRWWLLWGRWGGRSRCLERPHISDWSAGTDAKLLISHLFSNKTISGTTGWV